MRGDPPRCVRRALLAGRTNRDIVDSYPVDPLDVRRWRWRLRAAACMRSAVPLARVQSMLDRGDTVRQAAERVGHPLHVVAWLVNQGALLVRPRSPGYPCPVTWAKACARVARRLRHELAHEMLDAGLSSAEVAEVVGVTSRAVCMWRASRG
jgi:hypothetical protein